MARSRTRATPKIFLFRTEPNEPTELDSRVQNHNIKGKGASRYKDLMNQELAFLHVSRNQISAFSQIMKNPTCFQIGKHMGAFSMEFNLCEFPLRAEFNLKLSSVIVI